MSPEIPQAEGRTARPDVLAAEETRTDPGGTRREEAAGEGPASSETGLGATDGGGWAPLDRSPRDEAEPSDTANRRGAGAGSAPAPPASGAEPGEAAPARLQQP